MRGEGGWSSLPIRSSRQNNTARQQHRIVMSVLHFMSWPFSELINSSLLCSSVCLPLRAAASRLTGMDANATQRAERNCRIGARLWWSLSRLGWKTVNFCVNHIPQLPQQQKLCGTLPSSIWLKLLFGQHTERPREISSSLSISSGKLAKVLCKGSFSEREARNSLTSLQDGLRKEVQRSR